MTQPTYRKEIVWNRATSDYQLLLDGQLWGYASSYVQGERILDDIVVEQVRQTTVDGQLAWLGERYAEARAQGLASLAAALKREALELTAQRMGIDVDEFVAGYAAWKA